MLETSDKLTLLALAIALATYTSTVALLLRQQISQTWITSQKKRDKQKSLFWLAVLDVQLVALSLFLIVDLYTPYAGTLSVGSWPIRPETREIVVIAWVFEVAVLAAILHGCYHWWRSITWLLFECCGKASASPQPLDEGDSGLDSSLRSLQEQIKLLQEQRDDIRRILTVGVIDERLDSLASEIESLRKRVKQVMDRKAEDE